MLIYSLHNIFGTLTSRANDVGVVGIMKENNVRIALALRARPGIPHGFGRMTRPGWMHDGGRLIEGVRILIKVQSDGICSLSAYKSDVEGEPTVHFSDFPQGWFWQAIYPVPRPPQHHQPNNHRVRTGWFAVACFLVPIWEETIYAGYPSQKNTGNVTVLALAVDMFR